jgi:hypothetical protein
VQGRPVKMLDMYAEYVDQGYWVDVHISKVLYQKDDHALFEKVINAITFTSKSAPSANAFDAHVSKAEQSTAGWLNLWDNMKCRESYTSLSTLTRQDITEKLWIEWCTKVNTTLGKNNSRKLIATALTKSLPLKTDRPLAVMVYQSGFVSRTPVIEIVALLLEKDGSWSITNYLTQ